MVSFKTHDSCAAYAIPLSRGRLNQESALSSLWCISPRRAKRVDVLRIKDVNKSCRDRDIDIYEPTFPDAVGPRIKFTCPVLKTTSSSNFSLNDLRFFKFVFVSLDFCLDSNESHEKVTPRKPILPSALADTEGSNPSVDSSRVFFMLGRYSVWFHEV